MLCYVKDPANEAINCKLRNKWRYRWDVVKADHVPSDRCLPREDVDTSLCDIARRASERRTTDSKADARPEPWTPSGVRPKTKSRKTGAPLAEPDLGAPPSVSPRFRFRNCRAEKCQRAVASADDIIDVKLASGTATNAPLMSKAISCVRQFCAVCYNPKKGNSTSLTVACAKL